MIIHSCKISNHTVKVYALWNSSVNFYKFCFYFIIIKMNSLFETERGLPPGLWLPTAEESTDQYLRENFLDRPHDYGDIVDYGAFMVALIVLDAENSKRVSMMPTKRDVYALRKEGYGMTARSLDESGGLSRLQVELNFMPRGYDPPADKLLERYAWIADYALSRYDESERPGPNLREVIQWSSNRNLTPGIRQSVRILGADTAEVRRMFRIDRIERSKRLEKYTYHDIYRFGGKVIRENGGPLLHPELNERYANEFITTPHRMITRFFDSYADFWLEFNYVPNVRGLSKQAVRSLGVQWAIAHETPNLGLSTVEELSLQKRFASSYHIKTEFGGLPAFRELIAQDYKQYLALRDEFATRGVLLEVFKTASRRFSATPEFEGWLRNHEDTLKTLSDGSEQATYVLKLMYGGLNLDDDVLYGMQREDLDKCLKRLGIVSDDGRRFIFDIIPRINSDEALAA
jgi:hypothetical protein